MTEREKWAASEPFDSTVLWQEMEDESTDAVTPDDPRQEPEKDVPDPKPEPEPKIKPSKVKPSPFRGTSDDKATA